MAQKYKSYSGIKGSGILINTALPLDPRQVVEYKEDLIKSDTWTGTSVYHGMMVSVLDEQAVYMYMPTDPSTYAYNPNEYDPTKSEYWKKISSPDVQIRGYMVDIIKYQPDPQSEPQYYNKGDGQGEGEKWVPNEGAEPINAVNEAGKYLCLEVAEDKVYINSKNLIDLDNYVTKEDLDDYVTKEDLDASLRNVSISYTLTSDSEYVNTTVSIDETGRIISSSVNLVTASMINASNGIDGLATAKDVYNEIQKTKGNIQWEDEIYNENTEN